MKNIDNLNLKCYFKVCNVSRYICLYILIIEETYAMLYLHKYENIVPKHKG